MCIRDRYKTVHHDEVGHNEKVVVKDAWDEEVPKYEYQWVNVCNNCGEITYTDDEAILHSVSHLGESEASYHAEQIKVQKGTDTVSYTHLVYYDNPIDKNIIYDFRSEK